MGTNLSDYRFLEFLQAKNPEDLKFQLAQIRLPHRIISMYWDGKNHVAWVNLSRPIKKQKLIKTVKEFENG